MMIAYPAQAAGTSTRVLQADGGGAPVLFLHGVGSRADRWSLNLQPAAEAGFNALAIDLPGHGFAFKGPGFDYSVPGYAAFVHAFLHERGLSDVHLVGSSLGAHIAATVTCTWPGLAKSLTLVGATGMFAVGDAVRGGIAQRMVDLGRAGIENKLKTVIHDVARVDQRLVAEEHAINNSPGAAESFALLAAYFRERLDDDAVGQRLAELPARPPIFMAWGEQDRSVPLEVGRRAQALLGVPDMLVIAQAAHAPYWEQPAVFNAALLRFLRAAAG